LLALFNQGRYGEGVALARTMTERFPRHGFGWKVLGGLLSLQGDNADALLPLQKAAQLLPQDPQAQSNLGVVLAELNRLPEAEASHRRALAIDPLAAEPHCHLGAALKLQGRIAEAESCLRQAIALKPDYAEAQFNLGVILYDQQRFAEAEAAYVQALACDHNYAEAHLNLGVTLNDLGRLSEAENSYRAALLLNVAYSEAHNNLGKTLSGQGRFSEAETSFRRALTLKPAYPEAYSNLLFNHCFTASRTAYDCREEARQYGLMLEGMTRTRYSAWSCAAPPTRLRVGLISGDLRNNPVGYFLESLLSHIDPERIELIAYPTNRHYDEISARLATFFAAWKPLADYGNEGAARLIHADGVHVLIDASGHTAGNRLPVFAWKPAPIQVSWLGYFATTGVAEIDYLLGDPFVTPEEENEHFTEKVWRLPESYLCFTAPTFALEVAALPALSAGYVTFACFNNLSKMNDAVVALWARLLHSVPQSRLFLKAAHLNDQALCATTRQRFAVHDIATDRLILEGGSPRAELLAAYQRVDIALDPFPYPGGTTSLEALWMGVPVITRQGDRFLSHIGESIAHNAGLADWIAADDDDYIAKAVHYSAHLERLAAIRANLRAQVLASPLFNAPRFTRNFEAALWGMFSHWAAGPRSNESPDAPDAVRLEPAEAPSQALFDQSSALGKVNNQLKKSTKQTSRKKAQPSVQEVNALAALFNEGRYSEGVASARIMTQHFPLHGFGWKVLGGLLSAQGNSADALLPLQKAAQLLPQDTQAQSNLGVVLAELKRFSEAEACHRRALAIDPLAAEPYCHLGAALKLQSRIAEAEACLRQAIALKPDYAAAQFNLGVILYDKDLFKEAGAAFAQALASDHHYAEACLNLAVTLEKQGQLLASEKICRQALEIKPDFVEAHSNLGAVLRDLGQLDGALASLRQALEIKPDFEDAFHNLLFLLNYDPDKSKEAIFATYREYDERFGQPLHGTWRAHTNHRETARRLKVGYVSPDFCAHPVRYFLEPLLEQHDKQSVEIYAYAELTQEDEATARYKNTVDHWIPTRGLSDEALAERIRADEIDILVDLAGHTAHNRLPVFARKPAPVSVSWLGYGYTTGLTAIDYFLTDAASVPPGSEEIFSEVPWRLETPAYAYRPAAGMGPVGLLPARERGHITFGTLTRAIRINHRTIRVWSEILKRVEGSRLAVNSRNFQDPALQEVLALRFAAQGIRREQLDIGYYSPPWDVLRGFDIGLDCFPHNSGTTLFETLYMGVPYLTLAGRPSVGRLGSSILEGVGHPEWIASSEAEYIEKAVTLAADLPRLAELRAGLRHEMESGPLMDEAAFARKVETAYREMFARWAAGPRSNKSPDAPSPALFAQSSALGKVNNQLKKATKPITRKKAQPSGQEVNALAALFNRGRYSEGVVLARSMTQRFPLHGFGWKVLGATLSAHGNSAEALEAMQKSAQLSPQDEQAQTNLGLALAELNRLPEAEASHRRALAINPKFAAAHQNLGVTLKLQGLLAEAEASFRTAISLRPEYAKAQYNLGVTLSAQERFSEAENSYRAALAVNPDYAEAHLNLGITLTELGRLNEAENSYRAALAVNPDYAEAHLNLGITLTELGRLNEAENSYRAALAVNPDYADAYLGLGYAESLLGQTDLAETCYRRVIELNPGLAQAHTSLLFALSHKATLDAAILFAEHCRFGEQFEAPLRAAWPQHPNTRAPDRCLQVGFVSADLRHHAIANFIEPVLAHLAEFPTLALHAYYTHTVEDGVTRRLRTYLKHWHAVAALSDADLAQKIREDGIDLLIDLSGHTTHNRLLVFARKPAPVQVSWMGYPGTTGLQAMDYYLADRYYLPPGQFADQFTEKLAYLPASAPFLPFEAAPPVNALPASRAAYLTFGSFNRADKLNAETIALWSSLLRALPEARMLLGGMPVEGEYDKLIDRFAQEGIASDRLSFYPRSSMDAYLALHHQVDICLDTTPYAGGTTTLHALWMGVPSLSIAGLTPGGRAGASILAHVGLDAFIAQDAADFVGKGVFWAKNLTALAGLRAGLRARFDQSAIRHPEVIAASLERALRMMWQRWCKGLPAESFTVADAADERGGSTAEPDAPPVSPAPSLTLLDEACDKAIAYHHAEQLEAAEQVYRAILQAAPQHPVANHFLGLLSVQLQQPEAALPYLLAALEADPAEAGYWLAYLDALLLTGQTDTAQQVLALGRQQGLEGEEADRLTARLETYLSAMLPGTNESPPSDSLFRVPVPEKIALHDEIVPSTEEEAALALAFNQGRYSEGIALAQTMTEHFPEHGFGWKLLGALLSVQGHSAEALLPLQKAVQLLPQDERAQTNLGLALAELNRLPEAEACHRRALAINPKYANAYNNLGTALKLQGRLAEAEALYQQAVLLQPDYAAAHNNLGAILRYLGQLDGALASFRRALEIQPDFAEAHSGLSAVLNNLGQSEEALASARRALEIKPDFVDAHSNLLFGLGRHPGVEAQTLLAEHARFAEVFEAPLRADWPQHTNTRDPARCLQVGFVSGDLRAHPVASFIEPVLAHLATCPQLSLHAYANHPADDSVSRRLRGYFKHWHAIAGLPDGILAQKIIGDQIDVLIDLSGHTAQHRLLTFARKPAPLQASWIGYPGTTGLHAMDYYFTDRHFLPPGSFDHQFSEKLAYLPASSTFLPFEGGPPVNALPAARQGYLTLGSFNQMNKLNPSVIAVWGRLLRALPDAKMLLGGMATSEQPNQLIAWFAAEGIARERLSFYPRTDTFNYLALHHQVDFCLDTFPYNGGTTTLYAIQMGVPTLMLAGSSAAGRTGCAIAGHLGLEAFVAATADDFVEKGLFWASHLAELAALRATLRDRFAQSALGQPTAVAVGLERALRHMWQRWCKELPSESFNVADAADEIRGATTQTDAPPASPAPSPLLDEACDKAVAYQRAGQLEAAEQIYRAILQAAPQHPTANHFLGLLVVHLQQPEAALPYLLAALEANPTEADYWLAYLDALLLAGQTDEAQQVLELGRQQGLQGEAAEAIAARLHSKKQEETPLTRLAPVAKPTIGEGARPSAQEEATLLALFNQEYYTEGIERALSMTEHFPQHGFGWKVLGALLRSQGSSAEALLPLQKSAQIEPQDAQAQSNLGLVLGDLNRLPEAEACHRQALAINPRFTDAYNNLGATLKLQGRLAEAEASFQTALTLNPGYAEAQNNLGVTLYEQNRLAEAETAYRAALAIQPDYAEAYNNLGNVLGKQHRPAEAETNLLRALQHRPHFADAHYNLASALRALGRPEEAIDSFRQALIFKPNFAEAHINLGVTLNDLGRLNEAEHSYRAALALNADYAEAYHNLGNVLGEQGRGAEARDSYQKVLQLRPDSADAYSNLGYAEFALGESNLAEFYYRRAIELNPDLDRAHSSLLFALSHKATLDAPTLFAEHCRFGEQFEAPLRAAWPQHSNTRDPDRCLQVGFVSADLRHHAIANFIEPVLAHLAEFPTLALHAYYTHTVEDGVTQRLRTYLKHWHAVADLSDADLAQKIRADGIDLLIDLSGHTGHNRLLTFARKPAPVQASWMGYPGTTGLQAMDYYLADRHYLPPGQFADQFTEKLAYLPASAPFLPFAAAPPVNPLPILSTGYLTFGSFNRLGKLSAETITLWSQLLHAVPNAKMLLGGMPLEGGYDKLIDRFAQEGIARDRLSFYPRSSMDAYLALHHQVDICLDTYPYAGGTTTLHALWMGVPTLTVAGLTPAGRAGASILSHVGLDAFVAQDAADFVGKGVSWAKNLAELADLRAGLRTRCNQSAVRHPEAIAASLERALRIMWQRWCKGLTAASFTVADAADERCGATVESTCLPASLASSPVLDEACDKAIGYQIALHDESGPSAEEAAALVLLFNQEHYSEGVALARSMTQNFPLHGFGWKVLGALLSAQGNSADALEAMQKSVQLSPEDEQAQTNLGLVLGELNQLPEAEACHRRALALNPQFAPAHHNLGVALKQQGRLAEAEACYRTAIFLKSDYDKAHLKLGVTLYEQGRFSEAEAAYLQALTYKPDSAETFLYLGFSLHQQQGRLAEAEACYRTAISLKPDDDTAHLNLGINLYHQDRYLEAMACYRQALVLKPDSAEAENNLGHIFLDQGCFFEAESCFRRALALNPGFELAFGNLLFLLNYDPDKREEAIFAAYRDYDERFCQPLRSTWRAHGNSRVPLRRLKIGYVSPDFKLHPVRHFLEPLLARHDRQAFEVYAYAELVQEDEATARYKDKVDHWIPTQGLSDEVLAERIRSDEIDILVDLAGHTTHKRLPVFAYKPAPVSLSWLGYGYTTGLSAINYYLTDETSAPPGSEALFSETPWRLATPAYVYRPAEGMGPVGPLPARERGSLTFGTLTRAIRINHRTIRVWSAILKRVEGSRLVVNSGSFGDSAMQEALAARFAAHGIRREQLEIGYRSPPWDVLRGFDIGLDCFPHNSGTTLFETLYMGVPYVTLAGRPSVGRLGSSILEGLGHPEWIARSEEEYIEKAIALAVDLPRLAELRAGLRQEMEAGPLMDEAAFARKVETAYREMWQQWCAQPGENI
jgi:predicted O-linked N-acetylglucosamine transferase (SPINDLY family)